MNETDRDETRQATTAEDASNKEAGIPGGVEQARSEPGVQDASNNEAAAAGVMEEAEQAEGEAGADASSGDRAAALSETAVMEAELVAARQQADEYLDQWRRTAAEFQNFRRRQERERQELVKNANAQLLMRLLPVLDDLQRAAQHVPEELRDNEWVNGILMIERKLWAVVEQAGVRPIEAAPGMSFDPHLHDAVVAEPSEAIPSGHIIDELERGYTLYDKVLRPAKVRVAR
ncbi:MAG: nucleotide exchange factor GrpE [Ardenticatenaceae bacterium]|nr:nucleotide exchange factor GrpE [Ardenticatenaceae bacterium]HBY93548.1 nucleotide exchange factor GrpE [Chloroflexota bacterium]